MDENEVTGTCANGVCTVHGPGGKAEYSEVFEEFVPAFFAGAQVCHSTYSRAAAQPSPGSRSVPQTDALADAAGHGLADGGGKDHWRVG